MIDYTCVRIMNGQNSTWFLAMSVKHFFSWRAKRISSNDKLCSTVRTDNSSAMSSESLLRKGFWNIILDRELFFRTTLINHAKCVFFRHEGMACISTV